MKKILFLLTMVFAAIFSFAQNKTVNIDVTLDYAREYVVQTKTRVLYDTVTKTVIKQEKVVTYVDTTRQVPVWKEKVKRSKIVRVILTSVNEDGEINPVLYLADGTRHEISTRNTLEWRSTVGTEYEYTYSYLEYETKPYRKEIVTYRDVPTLKTETIRRIETYLDTTVVEKPVLTDWVCLDVRRESIASPTQFMFIYNHTDRYCIKLYNESTGKAYWFKTTADVYRKYINKVYKQFDMSPTRKMKLTDDQFRLTYDDYNSIEKNKAYRTAYGAATDNIGMIARVKLKLRCVSNTYNTDGVKQYHNQSQQNIPVAISVHR